MSTLRVNALQAVDGSGEVSQETLEQGSAKGWALVNMSLATPVITDSFNVTSMTDNAAGDFSLSWTTSFSSATYLDMGGATCFDTSGLFRVTAERDHGNNRTASGNRYIYENPDGTNLDEVGAKTMVFGELA